MILMTSLQIISSFYKNTVVPRYKSLLAIFGLWAVSQILLSLPLWLILRQTTSSSLQALFDSGTKRLSEGTSFLKAFTPEEFSLFLIIILSSLIIWAILGSYFEGAVVVNISKKLDLANSLKSAWKYMPKIVGANLLMAAVMLACILIGFTVGLIVFPLAGLFIIIALIFVIYFTVRLSFMTYEIVVNESPVTASLGESIQKTSKFSWAIFFILILTSLFSSALNALAGNSMIMGEVITAVIQVATIILLLPLFLEANKDARENQQSDIES